MTKWKAWGFLQHLISLVVLGKNDSKYNIPTAAVQYPATALASDSRNSSKRTRLYLISSHSTVQTCALPHIQVIIMPFASHRIPSEHVHSTRRSTREWPWRRGRRYWRSLRNLWRSHHKVPDRLLLATHPRHVCRGLPLPMIPLRFWFQYRRITPPGW